MYSIILMFGGGLVGGMISPIAALASAIAGFLIGRHAPEVFPRTPPCAQTDGCHLRTHE